MKQQTAEAESLTAMSSVTVQAPARLHLGFLDLNAEIGRKFGSIGVAINSHHTIIQISPAENFLIQGEDLTDNLKLKIRQICERFYESIGSQIPSANRCINICVKQTIPEHSGLGSGTQLALTVGTALAKFHGISISTPSIAKQLGRGKRSGIGIATFDHGGFVIDGGLKPNQTVPPILAHIDYPADWKIVLVMDPHHQGIHGTAEVQAFHELPIFPQENARLISHLTLMCLLPALIEKSCDDFGKAVTDIQALIGDHFAKAQGGRYTSKRVESCLLEAQRLGHSGVAQSSWGPTGCIFVENEAKAKQLIEHLTQFAKTAFSYGNAPIFIQTSADNHGAVIESSM
ncbi:MAG TPA: beta-hydroxylase [Methylophaga aminisulfidivorans]|uniref:beta-ribofuranosylaminobenzene 5'-phosphate synthase family protein n=1 Tax=Methylophaga TaxID=40222 RepID=UPI0017612EB0|nr:MULTISPECIES: beta-ribofuranosylaminobenzene 5'-phosphate synthase family protein [Methylophaga]HIC45687.1 beta-hydroxylase [Methylophaga sp.]HIM41235.1 beta-hydroxylase [Methylophaga aminisulfidivorans]